MANLLKNLTQKQFPNNFKLITSLNESNHKSILNQLIPLNPNSVNDFTSKNNAEIVDYELIPNRKSILNQLVSINPNLNNEFTSRNYEEVIKCGTQLGKMQVYPSFSIGYFLNPDMSNGSGQIEMEMGGSFGCDIEDSKKMWADSVKKKRKKKMNKHKLKKLRKRLRKRTKT